MNHHFWIGIFRREFAPQLRAIADTLEKRMLPAFEGIESEAEAVSQEAWDAFMSSAGAGDEDPGDFAEAAQDAGISHYMLLYGIRQGMLNLFAEKDVGISGQRSHAFLNARASGVVQANHGCAHFCGEIHNLDDLSRIRFGKRAAEDGEVLREDIDEPAFDAAVAGDEAVAVRFLLGHAEVGAAVGDEFVGLFEGAFVEQELDALPRRHFAFLVLALAALRASSVFGELVALLQFGEFLFEIHGGEIIAGGAGRQGVS